MKRYKIQKISEVLNMPIYRALDEFSKPVYRIGDSDWFYITTCTFVFLSRISIAKDLDSLNNILSKMYCNGSKII